MPLVSCSSGKNPGTPISPQITTEAAGAVESNHFLAGMFQVAIDTRTMEIDYAPLRSADFHLNMVLFLQDPNPWGFIPAIIDVDHFFDQGRIDVGITLIHPLPYIEYIVFDVKGIIMGDGNVVSKYDPSLIYPDINGPRIMNTDGWTRWWNKSEFTGPMIFGYNDGIWGIKDHPFSATLNPFKAYADHLGETTEYYVPEDGSRNRTSAGSILSREYYMQFPMEGGDPVLIFNYAIDCSWEEPADKYDPESFPPEANQPEAYLITVEDDGSDVFYHIGTGIGGGSLKLQVGIYDHGGSTNPEGTLGELDSLVFESQVLFDDPYVLTTGGLESALILSDGNKSVFEVTIPDCVPTGLDNQELLIHAITNDATYDQDLGLIGPSGNVAAYEMYTPVISDQLPVPDDITGLTIELIRDTDYRLTGFHLDWDDSDDAVEYVVYWYTDPYEVTGPWENSIEVADGGVVTVSEYTHNISGAEANGQWILEVVARAIAGQEESASNPSNKIFVDFSGFENYAEQQDNIWRIRSYADTNYNHFVIASSLPIGCGGSGALYITPKDQFSRRAVSYCVTPGLPDIPGISNCYMEFAHLRTEDFPLVTEPPWYDNDNPYGYSVCSAPSIYGGDASQTGWIPYGTTEDYNVDLVDNSTDWISGAEMNFAYIDGLEKRYNDPGSESSDPSNGWSGDASSGGDFELSRFNIPKAILENHNFVGVCWGGKQEGIGYNSSPFPGTSPLVCDEFAVVMY